jgi:uncharacterized protein YqjF (DUF2071 family)
LLPASLELDTFDGEAWVGVVPFAMSNIRPRFLPGIPGASAFPELNVRTYVRGPGGPGVWFFSLDAASRLAVRVARVGFHLPYFDARMSCEESGTEIRYESRRIHRGSPSANFSATYRPVGPIFRSVRGSLEYWLTERYLLYSCDARGRLFRGPIRHARWPLQPAEAEIQTNTMLDWLGLPPPDSSPLLYFSDRVDVHAWRIEVV